MKNLVLPLFMLVSFFPPFAKAQVIDVATQPGDDLRTKINNAIVSKDCTPTGCILDARAPSPDSGLVLDGVFADTRGKSLTLRLGISTYVASTNLTVPDDVALEFATGSKLRPGRGVTITINGPISAPYVQIFDLSRGGKIVLGTAVPHEVDPIWWGAKYDNLSDDSAAIQAAIDAAGNTEPVLRGGNTVRVSGPAAIASTLIVEKKATVIEGTGVGAISAMSPRSGSLRWIGPAALTRDDLTSTPRTAILRSPSGGFTPLLVNSPIKITGGANFRPGYYLITGFTDSNTVALDRDPTNGSSASRGDGSVVGGPMIEIKGSIYGSVIRRLRMYGNTEIPPRAAVSYVGASGFGASQHYMEDVWIGSMVSDKGFDIGDGISFYDAIYVGDTYDHGTSDNNDVLSYRNIVIQSCAGAGIRQGSIQNILMTVRDSQIKDCGYGIRTAGKVTLDHIFFGGQRISDIYTSFIDDYKNQTDVRVFGSDVGSENSSRFIVMDGSGSVDIHGGYWQLGVSTNQDRKVILAENANTQMIRLKNYQFTEGTGAPVEWMFSMRSPTGSASGKTLDVEAEFQTHSPPTLNVASRGPLDTRNICVSPTFTAVNNGMPATSRERLYTCNILIGNGDDWDPTRYDFPAETVRMGDRINGFGTTDIAHKSATLILNGPVVTATALIPANSLVLGVTARLIRGCSLGGGGTSWRIGSPTQPAKWGTKSNCNAGEATDISTFDLATVPGPYFIHDAEDVIITPNTGTFTVGTLVVTAHYVQLTKPVF